MIRIFKVECFSVCGIKNNYRNGYMFKQIILMGILVLLSCFCHGNISDANEAVKKKKYKVAISLFEELAKLGSAEAQYQLAIMLYQGQAGKVDKVKAVGWLGLASEYEYSNSNDLARGTFSDLSKEQQVLAIEEIRSLSAKFGKSVLEETIYPQVQDEPDSALLIKKNASILKLADIDYSTSAHWESQNSAIQTASARGGVASNQVINVQLPPSGVVVVAYDVNQFGRAENVNVIFSQPWGMFDADVRARIEASTFIPALNAQNEPVYQSGITFTQTFGMTYSSLMPNDYPIEYDRFRKYRLQGKTDVLSKYKYSRILRAFNGSLPSRDRSAFEVPLRESAEQGLSVAQVDFALYEIYKNKDVTAGLPWLISAAKSGYTDAEYWLGVILQNPPSPFLNASSEKARFWLNAAAKDGHAKAIERLVRLELKAGNTKVAVDKIKLFKRVEDKSAMNADTYYWIAKAYQANGDTKKAKKHAKKSRKMAKKIKRDVSSWQSFFDELGL